MVFSLLNSTRCVETFLKSSSFRLQHLSAMLVIVVEDAVALATMLNLVQQAEAGTPIVWAICTKEAAFLNASVAASIRFIIVRIVRLDIRTLLKVSNFFDLIMMISGIQRQLFDSFQ